MPAGGAGWRHWWDHTGWRDYRRSWLPGDVLGGVTIWALLIPEGLAYAALAGMPAVAMFATAACGLIVYPLLGSSRRLVVSVSSVVATLSAASVAATGAVPFSARWVSLTVTLALIAGVFALAAGVLRLGFLANFVSVPVQAGFLTGLALTIVAKELPALFGTTSHATTALGRVAEAARHVGDVHLPSVAVAAGSVVVVLAVQRFAPRVPGVFVALVGSMVACYFFRLGDHGVQVVGAIGRGLAPPSLPRPAWADVMRLIAPAGGLFLVAFAELATTARQLAERHDEPVDADRELLGMGAANVVTAIFGGYAGGASLTKSEANDRAGASTQLAGLFAAVLTVLTALVAGRVFRYLPEATLGVAVVMALVHLMKPEPFLRLFRLQRVEAVLAVGTAGAVVVIGVLPGFVLSVCVSILALVYRVSTPRVAILGRDAAGVWVDIRRSPGAVATPGVLVTRVAAPMFFANARPVRDLILATAAKRPDPITWLVLDLEETEYLDITAAELVMDLVETLAHRGIRTRLCRVHSPSVELLERLAPLRPEVPPIPVSTTIPLAVAACLAESG